MWTSKKRRRRQRLETRRDVGGAVHCCTKVHDQKIIPARIYNSELLGAFESGDPRDTATKRLTGNSVPMTSIALLALTVQGLECGYQTAAQDGECRHKVGRIDGTTPICECRAIQHQRGTVACGRRTRALWCDCGTSTLERPRATVETVLL